MSQVFLLHLHCQVFGREEERVGEFEGAETSWHLGGRGGEGELEGGGEVRMVRGGGGGREVEGDARERPPWRERWGGGEVAARSHQ